MTDITLVTPPHGMANVRKTFGDFKYTELSGGNVDVDDLWEKENLVLLKNVCGTGLNIRLHKLISSNFESTLAQAIKTCPNYKIRMLGGYCPRHKMHDIKRELSTHSWGIAFDVNWDKNPVSSKLITDLPKEFVNIFVSSGWNWGGNWKGTKDSMHFQFATGC